MIVRLRKRRGQTLNISLLNNSTMCQFNIDVLIKKKKQCKLYWKKNCVEVINRNDAFVFLKLLLIAKAESDVW